LEFVERLRAQEVYASVDDLVAQIGRDVEAVRIGTAEKAR
jgi:FAD synthase